MSDLLRFAFVFAIVFVVCWSSYNAGYKEGMKHFKTMQGLVLALIEDIRKRYENEN